MVLPRPKAGHSPHSMTTVGREVVQESAAEVPLGAVTENVASTATNSWRSILSWERVFRRVLASQILLALYTHYSHAHVHDLWRSGVVCIPKPRCYILQPACYHKIVLLLGLFLLLIRESSGMTRLGMARTPHLYISTMLSAIWELVFRRVLASPSLVYTLLSCTWLVTQWCRLYSQAQIWSCSQHVTCKP